MTRSDNVFGVALTTITAPIVSVFSPITRSGSVISLVLKTADEAGMVSFALSEPLPQWNRKTFGPALSATGITVQPVE